MRSGRSRLQHVAAEAALVGERRALVEDAAVDAAAEVLDEVAEDPAVDATDLAVEVDRDPGHARVPSSWTPRVAAERQYETL